LTSFLPSKPLTITDGIASDISEEYHLKNIINKANLTTGFNAMAQSAMRPKASR